MKTYLKLVSIASLLAGVLGTCKLPKTPVLNCNDIKIKTKAIYCYTMPAESLTGTFYDTLFLRIDSSYIKNDTTFYNGSTFFNSPIYNSKPYNKFGKVNSQPFKIWKTKESIFLKLWPGYLKKSGNISNYGNFWFNFPVIEKRKYADGQWLEYQYGAAYAETASKYYIKGKGYGGAWYFNCNRHNGDKNNNVIYDYSIQLSKEHFITSFNFCYIENQMCVNPMGTLCDIIYE